MPVAAGEHGFRHVPRASCAGWPMIERTRIVDVSQWPEEEQDPDEPLGARGSTWLVEPGDDPSGAGLLWIFKPVRQRTVVHEDQRPWFEEDWAEYVATRVGELLDLPVAGIELAVRHARRGVISPSFVPDRAMPPTFGNELLFRDDPGYPLDAKGEVAGYQVGRCLELLRDYGPPDGAAAAFTSASDAFAGYLLLDALVANTDRHHENWSVLQHHGRSHLSPCYDLGTCLGFQLTDPQRRDRLQTKDGNRTVRAWCEAGRSRTFEGRPRPLDVALQAFEWASEPARSLLGERLGQLEDAHLHRIVELVPPDRMSRWAGMFAVEALRINRDRLLERLA